MTTNLICSVTTHDALRADLNTWLDIAIRALQHIEASDGEPADVLIHKDCPSCRGAIGKLVTLTGEFADVWTVLQREESVSLRYICRRALDGCPLALQQFRSAMELERAMGGRS